MQKSKNSLALVLQSIIAITIKTTIYVKFA